ncbi:protein of unknown function [Methylocella tundrae]|uniref:Uncharacterized protein n=1 Tax=Methylocella tundrae TaxID=227605 RepID=A0A4V6IM65_METTU|nr:protein of unknown function [Methylocella tundrae]
MKSAFSHMGRKNFGAIYQSSYAHFARHDVFALTFSDIAHTGRDRLAFYLDGPIAINK